MLKLVRKCNFHYSVEENARALIEEKQKAEQEFREIIVSCKSLSYYESKRFKSLIPQASIRLL